MREITTGRCIAVGLVASLLLVLGGCMSNDPPPTSPPSCVNVRQILDDFEANEIAARAKYAGKITAICGYVDEVKVNPLNDKPYVVLTDSPTAFRLRWVFCYFPQASMSRLALLSKGDYVTISGVFDGCLLGSVFMENCTLH